MKKTLKDNLDLLDEKFNELKKEILKNIRIDIFLIFIFSYAVILYLYKIIFK